MVLVLDERFIQGQRLPRGFRRPKHCLEVQERMITEASWMCESPPLGFHFLHVARFAMGPGRILAAVIAGLAGEPDLQVSTPFDRRILQL